MQTQAAVLAAADKERKRLEFEMEKEVHQIIMKYEAKFQPLYAKLHQITEGGVLKPSEEEAKIAASLVGKEKFEKEIKETHGPLAAVWLDAMWNNNTIRPYIREAKQKNALYALRKVELRRYPDSRNFDLIFHFKENDFFQDTTLVKQFILAREQDPIETKSIPAASEMKWKEGKYLPSNKDGFKFEVFFDFFFGCNPKGKGPNGAELTTEQYNTLVDRLYAEFDVGVALRDELVPSLVDFYLGLIDDIEDDDEDDTASLSVNDQK
jgi:hypothetical protein